MAEYQVTLWRELPSLVVAREGDAVTKTPLAPRFQEAIDEAAMRLGDTGSDDYLAGWARSDWTPGEGDHVALADAVVKDLEDTWSAEKVQQYLDSLGPEVGA